MAETRSRPEMLSSAFGTKTETALPPSSKSFFLLGEDEAKTRDGKREENSFCNREGSIILSIQSLQLLAFQEP